MTFIRMAAKRRRYGNASYPPGGGGTAPTITGTPLLTDNAIDVNGTLPMTFYYTNTASATPPSAAVIKAAPDSRSLSSGANSLTGLTQEVAAGTWYFHYLVSNAAGDSATETESYVRTAPTISSTSPTDNATGVAAGVSPTITFSVPVQFGTGLITLRENNGGWADLETFDVTTEVGVGNGQVSISGSALTINPTAPLTDGREIAIRIASTAIENLEETPFAGVANDTTISFTVAAASARPQLVGRKAVTYAGSGSDITVSLTDLTGGLAAAPAAGDLVIIGFGVASAVDVDIDMTVTTSGYTEVADLFQNSGVDTNLGVFWKVMGGSPDTSVTICPTGSGLRPGGMLVEVRRGAHATTPMDVTPVTAGGTGTNRPTPGAITPSTADSVVVVMASGANDSAAAVYTSSDLTDFRSATEDSTNDVTVGIGHFDWTSGTFTPATWGGGDTSGAGSWRAVTMAIRPA